MTLRHESRTNSLKPSSCRMAVFVAGLALVSVVPSALAQAVTAEHAVLATDDRRTEALRRGNAGPLREIYADDYTLVTPAGVIRSKAEQITEIESGQLRYGAIEVLERTVRMYDDVAVVVSRDKYDILLRGRQVGGDIRFTRVYKRFGATWRVIATHGSPVAK